MKELRLFWRKRTAKAKRKSTAQAMVEFALALPILLLVMYGLIETGRLLFIYASVVSASRQAVRYGSATGDNGSGTPYFNDCNGIRNAAKRLGFLQPIRDSDIQITYDNGPTHTWTQAACPIPLPAPPAEPEHPANGDRIRVQVSAQFTPIVPLIQFRPFTITSAGIRTLLVDVHVAITAPGVVLTQGAGGVMSIFKQASPASFDDPNVTITYTYTVTNSGSTDLTNIAVGDPNIVGGAATCPAAAAGPVAPGASITCTATYVTSQPDVDAGFIRNVATATASDPLGVTVLAQTSLTINFVAKPALTLAKDGDPPQTIAVGQLISYRFTLTNSGNVPLTPPFAISDPLIGHNWSCPAPSPDPNKLAVDATLICTGTYPLTQNDLNRGFVNNTATATAMYNTFTVSSNQAPWTVSVPAFQLTVTASPATVTSPSTAISYTYTIKNKSLKYRSSISVTDTRGANKWSCSNWSFGLFSGQTASCTRSGTAAYIVTQADIDAGSILNTAQAQGSGGVTSNSFPVTVAVTQTINLTLTKTSTTTTATTPGIVIPYQYGLTNNGNVTLKAPFTLTDDRIAAATCAGVPSTLAPGASYTCPIVNYAVLAADVDAGSIINTAHMTAATASPITPTTTSNTASWQVITYPGARLGIAKSANPTNYSGGGQLITYSYTLKNTGGVPITGPYTVTDTPLGAVDCSGVPSPLAIGASKLCVPLTYTTLSTDSITLVNSVTATASGGLSATASASVIKFTCDSTTLRRSGPPIPDGSDVSWTLYNNTGLTLQIASISVSWGTVPPALTQMWLAGIPIGSGYPILYNNFSVPGAPWTLPLLSTVQRLQFSSPATGIHVVVTFSDSRCPAIDSNGIYPD